LKELLQKRGIEFDDKYLICLFSTSWLLTCYNHFPCILYILFTFNSFGIISSILTDKNKWLSAFAPNIQLFVDIHNTIRYDGTNYTVGVVSNNPQCSLRNWGKIVSKQPNSGGVDQKEKFLNSWLCWWTPTEFSSWFQT